LLPHFYGLSEDSKTGKTGIFSVVPVLREAVAIALRNLKAPMDTALSVAIDCQLSIQNAAAAFNARTLKPAAESIHLLSGSLLPIREGPYTQVILGIQGQVNFLNAATNVN